MYRLEAPLHLLQVISSFFFFPESIKYLLWLKSHKNDNAPVST